MKYRQYLLGFLLITLSAACFSMSLKSAKDQGLVGETLGGYLASTIAMPRSDVSILILDINNKRKEKYQEVANKVGQSLADVEKLAGGKAIEKTIKGHFIQLPNGVWKKK